MSFRGDDFWFELGGSIPADDLDIKDSKINYETVALVQIQGQSLKNLKRS